MNCCLTNEGKITTSQTEITQNCLEILGKFSELKVLTEEAQYKFNLKNTQWQNLEPLTTSQAENL